MKRLSLIVMTLCMAFTVKAQSLVTLPDGVEPEDYTLTITHAIPQNGTTQDTESKRTAHVAFSGNDVYVSGLAYYFPDAYVKGTLEGDIVTFAAGQFVGEDQYGTEFLIGYVLDSEGNAAVASFSLTYDASTRSLATNGSSVIAEVGELSEDGSASIYTLVRSALYTPGALPPLVAVEPPADLQAEPYLAVGKRSYYEVIDEGNSILREEKYQIPVYVGFSGDDLYIQGLVENVGYAWAKATKNAIGRYVIPKGQYIGTSSLYSQVWNYFLSAVTRTGALTDVNFSYSTADGSLSSSQTITVTTTAEKSDSYYWLSNVKIKKVVERETTPAAPELQLYAEKSPYGSTTWYYAELFIPCTDTDDEPLLADKLAYQFLADKGDGNIMPVTFNKSVYYMLSDDISEIPYNFTDGLDISRHTVYFDKMGVDEMKTWKRLGVQTIYRGLDKEHRSDIAWGDMTVFFPDAINDVVTDTPHDGTVYNLNGQRVDNSARGGLYIVNGRKVVMK